ncbi:MAG: SIS domain-containing protein, partial [Pseudomonadales bacterium]
GCAAYSAEHLPQDIAIAAEMLHQCFIQEGKILICGNGANAANGHHFSAALLSRFKQERPSLPAFNLAADSTTMSAITHESSFQDVFAKQITALGQQGDILVVLSEQGNCGNLIQAIQAAHDRNLQVISITGQSGGNMATILDPDDVAIRIPSDNNTNILQLQLVTIHCLCDLIDFQLFGSNE